MRHTFIYRFLCFLDFSAGSRWKSLTFLLLLRYLRMFLLQSLFSQSGLNVVLFLSFQAYELSTLTGTQVLLLVASETGHVYTFATRKLQPMITSETGKALIQTCLNSPDSPPRSDPSMDQRMSATGFEETDLTYQVSESESMGDSKVSFKSERCFLLWSGGADEVFTTRSVL